MRAFTTGGSFRAEGADSPAGGQRPEPARDTMLDIREPRARPDARLLEVRFRGAVGPADLARAVHEVRTRTDARGPGSLVVVRAFAARARTARVRTFAERDETGAWAWLGVAPGYPARRSP